MTIPNIILYNPAPQFTDDNGDPLDVGQLQIFEASTNILKTIYADNTQSTTITNPVRLGIGGFTSGGVWIPEGNYDLSIEKYIGDDEFGDPEFVRERFRENIAGAGAIGGAGGGITTLDSIDALRGVTPDTSDLIYVSGYHENNGVGAGFFRWDTLSNDTDDGGSVISPDGAPATGRWLRIFEGTTITMQQWGVRSGDAFTNASNVENMIAFAKANEGYVIDLNMPNVYLNGNVTFDGDVSVIQREGCRFRGLTGVHVLTFSCQDLTIESREELAEQFPLAKLTLVITSDIEVRPQWFGAVEGTGTNSTIYFEAMIAQSSTNDILIDQPFFIDSSDFSGRTIIKEEFGRIDIGAPITIGKVVSKSRIFSGDFSNLTFSENVINGEWFFLSGSLDVTEWSNFIDSCSSNGTKIVNWNSGNYDFESTYTPTNSDVFKLSFNVVPNVLFKAIGALVTVAMPKLVSRGYAFDNTSTGSFYFSDTILGSEVYLSQFGATAEDPTSLNNAIYLAVKSNSIINLDGQTYYISTPIDLTALSNEASFRNGSFDDDSSFVGIQLFSTIKNITFDHVRFNFSIADYAVLQSGTSVRTFFKSCYSVTLNTSKSHFVDDGTLNYFSCVNSDFYSGSFIFGSALLSGVFMGNYFNDSIMTISDFNNMAITGNNFYRGSASHSINLSIPVGQTDPRNGISITNNTYNGPSRNFFVSLADGNGAYGVNYGMIIENNTGTDISTEYNVAVEVDLSIPAYPILIDSYINWTAMQNSGFFSLNSAVTGLSNPSGSGSIEIVLVESFNSGDSSASITYTFTGTPIDQTIYATLRRVQ